MTSFLYVNVYSERGYSYTQFLISALDGVSGQPLGNFTVINRVGGLVGPEATWLFGKGKRFLSQPEIEPRFLACPNCGLIAMPIALSVVSRPVW